MSPHDHNTYDGVWHNQVERHSRLKHNIPLHFNSYPHQPDALNKDDNSAGVRFYDEYYHPYKHELFAFTTTVGGLSQIPHHKIHKEFLDFKPYNLWDYAHHHNQYYIDHHQSHATYAFLSSGYAESDILAIDGRGWKFNCIFCDKNGDITDLSNFMNVGSVWNYISQKLGFGYLGAGKVMGLAGYGDYNLTVQMHLDQLFKGNWQMSDTTGTVANILTRANHRDIAKTLQIATEEIILDRIMKFKSSDNLCVAGGVAYNGYINEDLTKIWDNVHIPPAVGDEGQSLGTYMHADYTINKNVHIPETYAGKEYDYVGDEKVNIKEVAQSIADGKIVGWFQGKSESGNRSLGNRSILADPRRKDIQDQINRRIKMREDFRPFAPSVLEEHYKEYFDTNQPSPYMSRIMPVIEDKRQIVPGITHVDGTARIQTVNKEQNEKFYDLINEFYKITGVPMLLNTSFNCQEPIVETPEQALNTFNRTEMDMVIINDYIVRKVG